MKIHIGAPTNWIPGQPLTLTEIPGSLNTKIGFASLLHGEKITTGRTRKPKPEPPKVYMSHWDTIRILLSSCGPNTKWLTWLPDKGLLIYCRSNTKPPQLELNELPWIK